MTLTNFQWYVIAINVVAFLVYTIDYHLYIRGGEGIKPEVLCNLVTICGGAVGAMAAQFLWDRRVNKSNVQSRIYTLTWAVVQVAFFWAIWGPNREVIRERVMSFYREHKVLCLYYAGINVVTFLAFMIDKIKAMLGAWRISEAVLLGLCLLGGGVGGFLAMDIFNHKVNKMYFMSGVPLLICLHIVLIVFVVAGAV